MALKKEEKLAWASFHVAHRIIARRIDERMAAAGVISLDVYGVLLALEESPEHRLRMSELADKSFLSRSGLTRMADRLESEGYIQRVHCPEDRRATYAQLTEKGLRARHEAWEVFQQGIEEFFVGNLACSEAEVVAGLFWRVCEKLGIKPIVGCDGNPAQPPCESNS